MGSPQPARVWVTWTGASDTAIAAKNAPLLLVNDSQSGRQVLEEAVWNMLRMVFLEIPLPPWLVKLKAARAGPRSDASLCLSVMNVAMAGPT